MRQPLLKFEVGGLQLLLHGKEQLRAPAAGEEAIYTLQTATQSLGRLELVGKSLSNAGASWRGPPVLFENGDYDLYLSGPPGAQLQCEDHPALIERVSAFPTADGAELAHYRMTLSNDVGHLRLALSQGRRAIHRLILEVYPTKIGYKTDYSAIAADLSRISHNLIFAAMSKTNFVGGLSTENDILEIEWFKIVQGLLDDLLASLDELNRQPQRRLHSEGAWRDVAFARLVDASRLNHALSRPGNVRGRVQQTEGSAATFGQWGLSEVPTRDWASGYDTPANRYVRWTLETIVQRLLRLRHWLNREASQDGAGRANWIAYTMQWRRLIDAILPQLRVRLDYTFIRDAHRYGGGALPTPLQSQPLYSRFYQVASALKKGISIEAKPFSHIGAKPIWLLYEYWCYAAILDIIAKRLEFVSGDIVQLDPSGSQLVMRKGVEGTVLFKHPSTGRAIRVIYNRLYPTPTTWQRPDAVVHIDTGSELHVFDAKYRTQIDPAYVATYGGPGPNLDDINTMHRYRDAIVNPALPGFPRVVRSAVVLFPSSGDGYADNRFFKSVDELGIGALPFLPSQTAMVATRLESILEAALAG